MYCAKKTFIIIIIPNIIIIERKYIILFYIYYNVVCSCYIIIYLLDQYQIRILHLQFQLLNYELFKKKE
jgi:hypothetical protein